MRKIYSFLVSLCLLLPALSAHAQSQVATNDTTKALTIERVFDAPSLSGPSAQGVQFSPDGKFISYLKPKKEKSGVLDLWAVPIAGGEPFILIDADSLSSPNAELSEAEKARRERQRISSRGIVSYSWAAQGRYIMVPLDGDIYLYEVGTKKISKLTDTIEGEIDAKLSVDAKILYYVRENTLYMMDVATKKETRLTPKAKDNVSYGVAEFIAQEELDRHTGYWPSANNDYVIYQVTDETKVETIERLEVGATGSKLVKQKYPYAGKVNATVSLVLKNQTTGQEIPLDLAATHDFYLARVDWAHDDKSFFVQVLSRDQKTLELFSFDAQTGKKKLILTEKSDSWVELHYDFYPLKDGSFIWSSQRDGNNHLYLFAKDGTLKRQMTKGDFAIKAISKINEERGLIYVTAGAKTPIEHHLYVTSYLKADGLTQISQGQGWWSANVSPKANAFVGTYSDPKTPPQTALFGLDGKKMRDIEPNRLDQTHPFYPYKDRYAEPEFGILKASDGQDLHYYLLKPVGFDPNKKYPVIVSIYGGPARATVNRAWVSPINRYYQEKGYIVFSLDNRGTPGRSRAFDRAIYQKFGGPDIDDQILGAKFLQSLPYVKSDGIGITGWSQGGFVALLAITRKDTPFKAAIAGAAPTDWRLYDTAYTERYMAKPQENEAGYRNSDVLSHLANLKPGSLFIMHGMSDDNVQFENATRVIKAMQDQGIDFEMALYPGEKHGVRGAKKSMSRHRLMVDFFDRKLKNN